MKFKLLFAWYDLWIGLYWDNKNRTLYILPLPMVGIVITLKWSWLEFGNRVLFQWLFIRLTHHYEDNVMINVIHYSDGEIMCGIYGSRSWYSIQWCVLPLTGWVNDYVCLMGPKFWRISKIKSIEQ